MFYGCTKFPACRFTSRRLPGKDDLRPESKEERVEEV
jgi:ssDNA-binding Zn-finger/Zn-ribbon topoisomerase 1